MNTYKYNLQKKGWFKKSDLLLYLSFLLIAIIFFVAFLPQGKGAYVEIYSENKLYGTYDLQTDTEIKVESSNGYNIVVIADGKVWIGEADCPGQDCVRRKEIDKANQSIICTPNKLIVIIKGESDIDAYTGGGS